ncbi:MAG: NADH-quinone oxidoreductase subunit NuoG [Steroidobacteraceae bacterium]
MSDDVVNIVVDDVPVKARKGQMIIQATDPAGMYIPRFCYHDKLSVAANCRMCLVEVEKAPKPLPACATPVAEGMKVYTRSPRAIAAQKATMEFLLINHPLDCPICDQGGECELQDLAVGFGRDISRYAERKRVVKDKSLGPLISTDMTRCIHCTRCVRFGQEIQGYPQLGTVGRGEHMEITTYVEQAVDHELSGNIIDLCPVGALNNKPFRYRGRGWEMSQHALVSPHDAVGANLYAHTLRGKLMRIVPRQNDAVNETWIADRDRFGFEGIYSPDRVQQPMLRRNGELVAVDWEVALAAAAEGITAVREQQGAASLGVLASPSCTVEEFFLAARIARGLGTDNIDHRLRQSDFSGQDTEGPMPGLGLALADVERLQGLLVVGSDLRNEVPLLAHRVRKAAVKGGAKVGFINPQRFSYLFPQVQAAAGSDVRDVLRGTLAAAAAQAGQPAPALSGGVAPGDEHRQLAQALASGERRAVFLGQLAQRHPAYAELRALAQALAGICGATLGIIAEGANAAGAYLAGAVPHRRAGGVAVAQPGLDARGMLAGGLKGVLLVGALDAPQDFAQDVAALREASCVVSLTPYLSGPLKDLVHVVLPIGTFAEGAGTFVNCEGTWQSWNGAVTPVGESRPGWKVLRVLGNLLALEGFDYASAEEVREDARSKCKGGASPLTGSTAAPGRANGQVPAGAGAGWTMISIYQGDALVRRSPSLAKTPAAQAGGGGA